MEVALCWFTVWKCCLLITEEAGQDLTALTFENHFLYWSGASFYTFLFLQSFSYLPILNPISFVMSWFPHSSPSHFACFSLSLDSAQVICSFLTLAVFFSLPQTICLRSPLLLSPQVKYVILSFSSFSCSLASPFTPCPALHAVIH